MHILVENMARFESQPASEARHWHSLGHLLDRLELVCFTELVALSKLSASLSTDYDSLSLSSPPMDLL